LLQAALAAGLASEGFEVRDLGVVPTPAVAALSAADGLPAAMISASHNPFQDNGIKLFAAGGRKLSDETEDRLEAELAAIVAGPSGSTGQGSSGQGVPTGTGIGRLCPDPSGVDRYELQLIRSLEDRRLGGLRVAVDCANGAAFITAPDVLRQAGADVVAVLGVDPDGTNINGGCGSTEPGLLRDAVIRHRADAGLAFDGDADRVIAVDHTGALVDGDQLLALFAVDMRERGRLAEDTVVVTVMTNLGFRLAMQDRGIRVEVTQVGDRHVLEALDRHGWSLGGEQSGHVIFRDLATTGDGVLTGLALLDLMARSGRRLADLTDTAMTRLPQVLRNVLVENRDGLDGAEAVWAEVAAVEAELKGQGRVLLRSSGTEPYIRVMVEAPTEAAAEEAATRLAAVVSRSLGSA
jgi:phosphoglucosamine mutase